MIDGPLVSPVAPAPQTWRDRPHFTASHRAHTICLREVQRLSDEIVRRLRARHASGELAAFVASPSPGRCMVQLGPVALTLAWLRGSLDVVAEGQLMVVAWEGAVVHGTRRIPERAPVPAAASARPLHEETWVVAAEDEASWRWQSVASGVDDCTTLALADRCIAALMRVHAEHAEHAELQPARVG